MTYSIILLVALAASVAGLGPQRAGAVRHPLAAVLRSRGVRSAPAPMHEHEMVEPMVLGADGHGRAPEPMVLGADGHGRAPEPMVLGADGHGRAPEPMVLGADGHGQEAPPPMVGLRAGRHGDNHDHHGPPPPPHRDHGYGRAHQGPPMPPMILGNGHGQQGEGGFIASMMPGPRMMVPPAAVPTLGADGHGMPPAVPVEEEHRCPCVEDIDDLCGAVSERAFQSEEARHFVTRLCLREHRDSVSEECNAAIASRPGLAEACFIDIEEGCADVAPGDGRVHECLFGRDLDTIQPQCGEYLVEEMQAAQLERSFGLIARVMGLFVAVVAEGPPPQYRVDNRPRAYTFADSAKRVSYGVLPVVVGYPGQEQEAQADSADVSPAPAAVPEDVPEDDLPEDARAGGHRSCFGRLISFLFWGFCLYSMLRCCRGRRYEQASQEEFEAKVRPSLIVARA